MSEMGVKVHLDTNGQDLAIEHFQDVEPVLEANKLLRGEKQTRTDGLRHVASIPNVILVQWLDDEYKRGNTTCTWGSKEFDELIARKLRDPDWHNLRTDSNQVQGRIGYR